MKKRTALKEETVMSDFDMLAFLTSDQDLPDFSIDIIPTKADPSVTSSDEKQTSGKRKRKEDISEEAHVKNILASRKYREQKKNKEQQLEANIETLTAEIAKSKHEMALKDKENEFLRSELVRLQETALWTKGAENLNSFLMRKANFKNMISTVHGDLLHRADNNLFHKRNVMHEQQQQVLEKLFNDAIEVIRPPLPAALEERTIAAFKKDSPTSPEEVKTFREKLKADLNLSEVQKDALRKTSDELLWKDEKNVYDQNTMRLIESIQNTQRISRIQSAYRKSTYDKVDEVLSEQQRAKFFHYMINHPEMMFPDPVSHLIYAADYL